MSFRVHRKLTDTKLAFAFILPMCFAQGASTSEVTWPANGHRYEAVYSPGLTWQEAQAACVARGGYLATITDADENGFIKSLFENDSAYWYVDGVGNALGPWIGGLQASGSAEPSGGWGWVTGEPFGFSDWSAHDPDNCCGLNQNRIEFIRDRNEPPTRWTDVEDFARFVRGYVCERSCGDTAACTCEQPTQLTADADAGVNQLAPKESGGASRGIAESLDQITPYIIRDSDGDFRLLRTEALEAGVPHRAIAAGERLIRVVNRVLDAERGGSQVELTRAEVEEFESLFVAPTNHCGGFSNPAACPPSVESCCFFTTQAGVASELVQNGYHQLVAPYTSEPGVDYSKVFPVAGCPLGAFREQARIHRGKSNSCWTYWTQSPEPNPEFRTYELPEVWWPLYVAWWHGQFRRAGASGPCRRG